MTVWRKTVPEIEESKSRDYMQGPPDIFRGQQEQGGMERKRRGAVKNEVKEMTNGWTQ